MKKDEYLKGKQNKQDHGTIYVAMNTEKDQNDKQLAEAENLADEFFGKLGESLGINLSWAKKPVFAEKEKREIKLDIVLDNPISTPE